MNRAAFQGLLEDRIDHSNPMSFRDVLSAAHGQALAHQPELASMQGRSQEPVKTLISWLEISFFFEPAHDSIGFYGVQPVCMDMSDGKGMQELPVMTLAGAPGTEQELDWEAVVALCAEFNRNLPLPIALPVVRVAIDETRARSVYYRLRASSSV